MKTNKTTKKKIAIIGAILYTLIIGIGMYISYHINGVDYTKPELVNTLWYIEIILTLLALIITVKYFTWKEIGFTKLDRKQLLWFLPSIVIIVVMWIGFLKFLTSYSITSTQFNLLALVGFTTLLVGFSEELMYRGIVFNAFFKTDNKIVAVLISAVTFSLLHAVNIFAGLSTVGLVAQLVLTFLLGLFFGLIRLRIKNIIPLILFHWLWDFILIGSSIFSYEVTSSLAILFILQEFILVIILLILLYKEKKAFLNI